MTGSAVVLRAMLESAWRVAVFSAAFILAVGCSAHGTQPYTDVDGGYADGAAPTGSGDAPVDVASSADASSSADAPASSVPRDALVAEWLFSGNALDTSGNHHDGTSHGAALRNDRHENAQSAYYFDGQGAMIEVPPDPALDLVGDFSISAWILPDGFSFLAGIVSKYQSYATEGITLRLGSDAPYEYIDFMSASGPADAGVTRAQVAAGRWQHVAAVLHSGTAQIYVDGNPAAVAPSGYAVAPNTDPLRIGVDYTTRFFVGSIDDVRIYARALSSVEVLALYDER